MYDRSYGSKYAALGGKYVSAADIAKLMRADMKELIASGELPGKMADYSVKIENYSGGRSIRISALYKPEFWMQCPGHYERFGSDHGMWVCQDPWCKAGGEHKDSPHAKYHDRLSAEGQRVEAVLKSVHAAYNHNGSDVMTDYFDVNYYGDASVEDQRHANFRASEKARAEARKARKLANA